MLESLRRSETISTTRTRFDVANTSKRTTQVSLRAVSVKHSRQTLWFAYADKFCHKIISSFFARMLGSGPLVVEVMGVELHELVG